MSYVNDQLMDGMGDWIARATKVFYRLEFPKDGIYPAWCRVCLGECKHAPDCELAKLIEEAKEYIDGE